MKKRPTDVNGLVEALVVPLVASVSRLDRFGQRREMSLDEELQGERNEISTGRNDERGRKAPYVGPVVALAEEGALQTLVAVDARRLVACRALDQAPEV